MTALPKEREHYTYADYCAWEGEENERWELLDGVPYAMAPAPGVFHQRISRRFSRQFDHFLDGKPCELFTAPFDVRLFAKGEDDTVVQPDLLVVCDKSKLDGKCCNGAPDLVVEILSPSTARRDRLTKYNLYRRAGVREYWIVDPDYKTVSVNVLSGANYIAYAYGDEDSVPVAVLPGCAIDLGLAFAEEE